MGLRLRPIDSDQAVFETSALRFHTLPRNVKGSVMTKPISDKAEVAVEYPDNLYIGTFAHTARFDAHLDQTGIALTLELPGPDDQRKSVHMHFHYALFAEVLSDLAKSLAAIPPDDLRHREMMRDSAKALYQALQSGPPAVPRGRLGVS